MDVQVGSVACNSWFLRSFCGIIAALLAAMQIIQLQAYNSKSM